MAGGHTLEAVLFDFDGTLFDLELDLDEFKRTWRAAGLTVGAILAALDGDELTRATAQLEAAELAGVRAGRPVEKAAQVLAKVGARYQVAVVSRNGRAAIEAGLAKMDAESMQITSRESSAAQKPAPEPLHLAIKRLGVTRAVLVGDTSHDVQAAAAAGIPSVVVTNPKLEYAPKGAQYYIDNLQALPALLEEL